MWVGLVEQGEKLLPWYYNVWFEGKLVEGYEKAQKVFKAYEKAGAVCWGEVVDIVEVKLDDLEPYKNSLGKSYISLSGLYEG